MGRGTWLKNGPKRNGVKRQVQLVISTNNIPKELERINAFLLLDLLGHSGPNKIAHTIGHGTKHLFNKIVEIGKDVFLNIECMRNIFREISQ